MFTKGKTRNTLRFHDGGNNLQPIRIGSIIYRQIYKIFFNVSNRDFSTYNKRYNKIEIITSYYYYYYTIRQHLINNVIITLIYQLVLYHVVLFVY